MSIYSKPIISAQTAAKTAAFFLDYNQVPARLSASGLAGSESVTISTIDGPASGPVVTPMFAGGAAVTLTATNTTVAINAPGQYQITKSVTAAAAAVFINSAG